MSRTWNADPANVKWSRTWVIPSARRLESEDDTVTATISWEDATTTRPDGFLLTVETIYETARDSGIFVAVDWLDLKDFEAKLKSLQHVGATIGRRFRDSLNGGVMAERSIDRIINSDAAERPSTWAIRQAYKHGWDGVGTVK